MDKYLKPTPFIDFDSSIVQAFALNNSASAQTAVEKAVSLYYAVRDQIRYNPYDLDFNPVGLKASTVISKKRGFCISKAIVLAAVARFHHIPARLGFADVTNHLSTEKLRKTMGTDLFLYHGYTELYLNDKWVKATPSFNLSLCTKFNVKPLEFDGYHDSMFQEFDTLGQRHMEYVRYHGHFDDLPFQRILDAFAATYPIHMGSHNAPVDGDFQGDAERENG